MTTITPEDIRQVRVTLHTVSGDVIGVDMSKLTAKRYVEQLCREGVWIANDDGTSTYHLIASALVDAEIHVPDGAPKRVA